MSNMIRRDQWSPAPAAPYVPRRVQAIQHLAAWKNSTGTGDQGPGTSETLWLRRLIGTLFQSFVTAALPGQPAAEMLPHTAQLWVDVLLDMNLTEDDTERIQAAGRKLLRELEEWPQVKALIAAMPRRREPGTGDRGTVQAETAPTEADREASKEALRKIREML